MTNGGHRHTPTHPAGTAGRVAAVLLVLAGIVTMASVVLPAPPGFQRSAVLVVGGAGTTLGALLFPLPWRRWTTRTSLVLVAPALGLITLHNWYGGDDPYRYSIFFLVVFVWVGTFHPSGTSTVMAVPTVIAYLTPLVATHKSASALASAAYAVPLFVVIGEILAWRSTRVSDLENELRDAALHDPLTGLANRRLIMDRLASTMMRAARDGVIVHVLYVDVDNFKAINDTFGHASGDGVLVIVAEALRSAVRSSDTVGRVAGDEFVVVIEGADVSAGADAAARIRAALAEARCPEAGISVPTVSIGIANTDKAFSSADELLRRADAALYMAKQAGKNCTELAAARARQPA